MQSTEKSTRACDLILFGASGDLSFRKILPALYQLECAGLLNQATQIIACDREKINLQSYIHLIKDKILDFSGIHIHEAVWESFISRIQYCCLDINHADDYVKLSQFIKPEQSASIFYLAIPSVLYSPVCKGLAKANLIQASSRVVMEKPVGHDTSSSVVINDQMAQFFSEEQIYRIDHYLGKETVLNLLALRFANPLLSESWNNRFIEKIEIIVAEEIGVEGRWNYYDNYGQVRDMLQNHLLQLVSLLAMEPPLSLSANDIRFEKTKVLSTLRHLNKSTIQENVIRGQYSSGLMRNGQSAVAYTDEAGANPDSKTETLVALKAYIDNERWAGVPFYVLTGKRLSRKCSEVVVSFKPQLNTIFHEVHGHFCSNKLVVRLQPDEGISLSILSKVPGYGELRDLQNNLLDLNFQSEFKDHRVIDAYERLLLEIMAGNQYLFVSREEIEKAWQWIDSIKSTWDDVNCPLRKYPSGTRAPDVLKQLFNSKAQFWNEDAVS